METKIPQHHVNHALEVFKMIISHRKSQGRKVTPKIIKASYNALLDNLSNIDKNNEYFKYVKTKAKMKALLILLKEEKP